MHLLKDYSERILWKGKEEERGRGPQGKGEKCGRKGREGKEEGVKI